MIDSIGITTPFLSFRIVFDIIFDFNGLEKFTRLYSVYFGGYSRLRQSRKKRKYRALAETINVAVYSMFGQFLLLKKGTLLCRIYEHLLP